MLHEMEEDEKDVHFVVTNHEPEAASPAAGRGGAPRFTKLEPGFRLNCENAADACLRDGDEPPIAAAGAPIVGDSSCRRSGDESSVQNVDGEKVVETPDRRLAADDGRQGGRVAGLAVRWRRRRRLAVVAFSPVASCGRCGDGAERRVGGRRGWGGDGASAERSGGAPVAAATLG